MNMTTDIYSDKAIDLVIFTIVDEATIRSKVWDEDLISPAYVGEPGANGLSLFVVTVPADAALIGFLRQLNFPWTTIGIQIGK